MTAVLRGNAALACAQVVTRKNRFQLFPGCVNTTGRDMEATGNGSACSHVCANYKSSLGDPGDFLVGSVILFVIVSAVVLNTFVICSFAARWKNITIMDYYILTLAVSDLCSPLFAYPMAMMSTFSHRWLFGETGCIINGFLGFFFGIADIFTLSLLSFSRFLCVCYPTSFSCFTRKRVLASIIGVAVVSTFWATCPLFGWGDYDVEPFGTSCTLKWSSTDSSYVTSVFMGCLVVPLGIMSLSYGCILSNTLRASRRLRQHRPNYGPRRTRHELRLIKITLLMSACFLLAWLPYSIVSMVSAYVTGLHVSGLITVLPTLLAKVSHISNPLVYFTLNPRLRQRVPCCPGTILKIWATDCSSDSGDQANARLEFPPLAQDSPTTQPVTPGQRRLLE